MSFLDRIGLIRELTNGESYSQIGGNKAQSSYYLFEESKSRFIFIADIEISKKILLSNNFESLNHLGAFIKEEDKKDLNYILKFLQLSPEFSSNIDHKHKSSHAKKLIKRFYNACEKVNEKELQNLVNSKIKNHSPSSAIETSKLHLSSYLTLAGKIFLRSDRFIFREEHITEKFGFFSTIPRIKRLKEFNNDIENHILECNIKDANEDDIYLLLLLRIMGSAPLNATLTSLINDMIEEFNYFGKDPAKSKFLYSESPFNSFLPTRFVLRRATRTFDLGELHLKKDDNVFVYLASTNSCPLRHMKNLPFGYGSHFCPGQRVSEKIIKTMFKTIIKNQSYCNLRKSEIDKLNAGAFLSFLEVNNIIPETS